MTVYLIAAPETGFAKIGYARNIATRLYSLQIGNPFELVLVSTRDGGQPLEAEIHRSAEHLRQRGEWFRHCEELLTIFADTPAPVATASSLIDISNLSDRHDPRVLSQEIRALEMTVDTFAKLAGVGRATLFRMFNGSAPNWKALTSIRAALDGLQQDAAA